ncbi:flavodoxin domain-containing protein [Nocardia anaemiae]|uniref:flavodoxin domain-containing protein n=1 Tax=Nocardia anaemiae TaxID=263910 RepID=UPI0007A41E5F|nr:flavodoxin domain-containing protein [Nocardia anaemiae]
MESNASRIAVIYATEKGSTRDIAEFIAAELGEQGAEVELADAEHAPELSRFDTVVLGSAIHDMELLPAAVTFVRTHREALRNKNVWLFSVGLGPALGGPIGSRIGRIVPKKIAALRDSISPRDYQAFSGHYEHVGVSLKARILYRLMGGGRYGDLRDWAAIRTWSTSIAQSLGLSTAQSNTVVS